jgi:hypothetical protein
MLFCFYIYCCHICCQFQKYSKTTIKKTVFYGRSKLFLQFSQIINTALFMRRASCTHVKIYSHKTRHIKTPAPPPAYRNLYPQYKHRGELRLLRPPRATPPTRQADSGGGTRAASIIPPPRRRASPIQKTIGGVYSRRSASLHSGRKPFINGSKGEGQPPDVAGGRKVEKQANIPVCLFFFSVGRPGLPALVPPRRGVLRPPSFSASHHSLPKPPHGYR